MKARRITREDFITTAQDTDLGNPEIKARLAALGIHKPDTIDSNRDGHLDAPEADRLFDRLDRKDHDGSRHSITLRGDTPHKRKVSGLMGALERARPWRPADGIAQPTASGEPLYFGHTGPRVLELQQALGRFVKPLEEWPIDRRMADGQSMASVPQSGSYDSRTENTVMQLQAEHGLTVTGVADAPTQELIARLKAGEDRQDDSARTQAEALIHQRMFRRYQEDPFGTPYEKALHKLATEAGMPVDFLRAIVVIESGFKHETLSKAGAYGLAQIMECVVKEVSPKNRDGTPKWDRKKPEDNLRLALAYWKWQRRYISGNNLVQLAAGYNAGPSRLKGKWQHRVPVDHPTVGYVRDVLLLYRYFTEKTAAKVG